MFNDTITILLTLLYYDISETDGRESDENEINKETWWSCFFPVKWIQSEDYYL